MATHFPRNLSGIEPTSKSNGLHAIYGCVSIQSFQETMVFTQIFEGFVFFTFENSALGMRISESFLRGTAAARVLSHSPMSCSPRDESKKKNHRVQQSNFRIPTSSNFRMKPVLFFLVSLQAPVHRLKRALTRDPAVPRNDWGTKTEISSRPELRNLHHLSDTFRTWGVSEVMVKFDNSTAVKPTRVMVLN